MRVILRGHPLRTRFLASFIKGRPDECWIWFGSIDRNGYGQIKHGKKMLLAHRLAWSIRNGQDFPAGMVAMHMCDRRPCVNPDHIRPGTIAENTRDAVAKGRHVFGERSSRAKLTDEKVREMVRRKRAGETAVALAAEFGVSDALVGQILRGEKWAHASGVEP